MPATYKYLRLPGFSTMLFALLMAAILVACIHQPLLADPDIGWHLRNAQLLLTQHAFIRHDTYSFTLHGAPWIDPEWLSEVAFYNAWRWLGQGGVEALAITLLEALTAGVCFLAWQRTRMPRAAVLVGVVFFLFASVTIAPRTQLFGWLCCIVELAILHHARPATPQRRTYLWSLPPLFALWINLHGSWPIGIALLVVFMAAELISIRRGLVQSAYATRQLRSLCIVGAISVAVLFLNPYGWHLVVYPFIIAGHHPLTIRTVQEWQSIDFHSPRGRIVFLIVAALLATRIYKTRTWTPFDALTLFLAVFAGFTYARFLLFTGIILCPLLAEECGFVGRDNPAIEKRLLNTAIIAAILAFCVAQFPSASDLKRQSNQLYPEAAVAWMREHPPTGPILNEFNWGGYMIWNLPSQPVFIDTRTDVFEETGIFQDYLDLLGLHQSVDSYRNGELQFVFLPTDAILVSALRRSPQWSVVYQDEIAVILRRNR